jgi:hypothetical protein
MSDKTKIMLIHESVVMSWLRDASTFALFFALIGIGWFIGSSVLEVVGAIVAFITIASTPLKEKSKFTVAEARAELDKIEAGRS